jgi:hypothetical protein
LVHRNVGLVGARVKKLNKKTKVAEEQARELEGVQGFRDGMAYA